MCNVAYLGSTSTFGFQAAVKEFAFGENFISYPTHADVFQAVVKGDVNYGVMAIENVDAGIVAETIRPIVRYRFSNPSSKVMVCSEVSVPVNLFMMAHKNTDFDSIQTIASHEMALLQSSNFLEKLLEDYPNMKVIKVSNTSEAARLASKDTTLAALSSSLSMHEYGLKQIHADKTENKLDNSTRFWVIGTVPQEQTGNDKTCVVLFLNRDLPGAISQSLGFFKDEAINISVLHPVPHPTVNYEYLFVVELETHQYDPKMQRAIQGLKKLGVRVDILGSYANRSTAFTSQSSIYLNSGLTCSR